MANKEVITSRTVSAHKSYSFCDEANPRTISDYWFQETVEGKTLFLVFYTQACKYSKCLGCNLPSKMSGNHIDYRNIMKQVDSVFHNILDDDEKKKIKKIIVSNNGSVLDEETFSTTALIYLVARIKLECPDVRVISLETRTEYVDFEELEILSRALVEGDNPVALEIAIGFEAFDDHIRNYVFQKGLSLDVFEKLAHNINRINAKFVQKYGSGYSKMKIKTYFMQKPVSGLTERDSIDDIKKGIDYLHQISNQYDIDINMHLNPTYVARGTILEEEFYKGNYSPPLLEEVVESVKYSEGKSLSVYIGLNDEGLAVENGSFIRSGNKNDIEIAEKLEKFNSTQDYNYLK
jgi:radical SAM enzyme (TIGR01210 family)